MTLKLKQEITITVELEYECIDARGAVHVLAAWIGPVLGVKQQNIWDELSIEDQAALTDACAEDLIEREEATHEAAYEAARELEDDEP